MENYTFYQALPDFKELMPSNCSSGEDSGGSLGQE